MSNSLDPDQARRIVRPDLGPNCLPKLSADGTGRQRVKAYKFYGCIGWFVSELVGILGVRISCDWLAGANFWLCTVMRSILRKPAFCICKNKDVDQLCGNSFSLNR